MRQKEKSEWELRFMVSWLKELRTSEIRRRKYSMCFDKW